MITIFKEALVYRHGDRAPIKPIPTSEYCDPSYWPMGFGHLTKFGIERQYDLGKWLRKRYDFLLSPTYKASEIYVRSTDEDRVLMSAYSNLAGLYPPQGSQVWNDRIFWQPIPVHTIPRNIDDVIVEKRSCPKYDTLLNATIKSDYFSRINDKYADLYETISNWTGIDVSDVEDIKLIRSTLYAIKSYNATYLPEWEKDMNWHLIDNLAGLAYLRYTSTPAMKRLKSGPFFHYLLNHLDLATSTNQASPAPKMLMISAHDTSLSGILNSMGVFDGYPPDFAATVIWELKKRRNGERYINLYFKSEKGLEKLRIIGCEIDCNYGTFKDIMEDVAISIGSWAKECNRLSEKFV
ncbi:unnamed protein product [Acanthoscelides obtectus]|uniref:acid phosphatase n=1 Tax=Acanthoscelides obtectus TaxID=200917 RepID=A0A9P0KQ72_ACAOB|nr:unnamed protein product [Acanthoscelides obtectus]CAK1659100.1 Prostatic acid phosphatase [Acanthoscelides obtectus]